MLRDWPITVGFVIVATCVIAAFYAVVYFSQVDEPPNGCEVNSLGRQRYVQEDGTTYLANITVHYCNLVPTTPAPFTYEVVQ